MTQYEYEEKNKNYFKHIDPYDDSQLDSAVRKYIQDHGWELSDYTKAFREVLRIHGELQED